MASLHFNLPPCAPRADEIAKPKVVAAYEVAKPKVVEAYEIAKPKVVEAYTVASTKVRASASRRGRSSAHRWWRAMWRRRALRQ